MKKRKRAESIMQSVKECYVCRAEGDDLHPHHAMKGTANRAKADEWGLWVWLCPLHHMGTYGVHGTHGHNLDLYIKQRAEQAFLEKVGDMDMWMEEFGKNFL